MAVKFEAVEFVVGATSVSISAPGFGEPKAALFFTSGGTTDGTIRTHRLTAAGFAINPSGEAGIANRSEDAQTTSDTSRKYSTGSAVVAPTFAGSGTAHSLSVSSWDANGVTIAPGTGSSTDYLAVCVLIGGEGVLGVAQGTQDLGTGTSPIDITSCGFEPTMVFGITMGGPAGNNISSIHSFGVALNKADGTVQQRSSCTFDWDGQASGVNSIVRISTEYLVAQIGSAGFTWGAAVSDFDEDGFSLTPSASTSSDDMGWFALKLSDEAKVALVDMAWPSSGNYSETGVGFRPSFGMIQTVGEISALDSDVSSGNILAESNMMFGVGGIRTICATADDGQDPTVTKSLYSTSGRILNSDGSTDDVLVASWSFTDAGWDFNLTTNPSADILGWGLAVGTPIDYAKREPAFYVPVHLRAPELLIPGRKPVGQGFEVDWNHPLANGLSSLYMPTSAGVVDLVKGDLINGPNNPSTTFAPAHGMGGAYSGSDHVRLNYYESDRTLVAIASWTGSGTDQYFFNYGRSSSATPIFGMIAQNTNIRLYSRGDSGAVHYNLTGSKTVNDGEPHVFIITASVATGGSAQIYVDGELDTSTSTGSSQAQTLNLKSLGALERTSVSNYFTGNIYLAASYSRKLTGVEAKALSESPYSILKPRGT